MLRLICPCLYHYMKPEKHILSSTGRCKIYRVKSVNTMLITINKVVYTGFLINVHMYSLYDLNPEKRGMAIWAKFILQTFLKESSKIEYEIHSGHEDQLYIELFVHKNRKRINVNDWLHQLTRKMRQKSANA